MIDGLRDRLARPATVARRASDAIGGALFLAVFACFVVQVVSRYVFNHPMAWTDELAVVVFVVLACWSSTLMTSWKEHVTLDVVLAALAPGTRYWLRSAGLLAMAALFVLALPATLDLVVYMSRKYTPVLDINQFVIGAPFLLLLVGFAVRALVEIVAGPPDRS
jgi:TRAP-type C4-dicarboxylate transport system permease small subunit